MLHAFLGRKELFKQYYGEGAMVLSWYCFHFYTPTDLNTNDIQIYACFSESPELPLVTNYSLHVGIEIHVDGIQFAYRVH